MMKIKNKRDVTFEDLKCISEDIYKKMKKYEPEYLEIRAENYLNNDIYLVNGNVEAVSFRNENGIGVRYTLNGCLGFFSINIFDGTKINSIIERSIQTTKKSSKIGKKIEFSKEKIEKKKYEVKQKKDIRQLGIEYKLEYIKNLDANLFSSNAKFQVRTFYYADSIVNKYYFNSEGCKIESTIPRIDIFYNFSIKENAIIQRTWQYGIAGGFEKIEKMKLEEKIKAEANALRDNVIKGIPTPKGEMQVIVSPEITGIMVHESVGHPYEADRILGRETAQAGESFVLPEMLGKRIGSEIVNVADDPTLIDSFGYYLYDDEGVKARRKLLIKDGRINEFLHNRETAPEFQLKSNGSARASSFAVEPIIRMSNTVVLPGDWSEEEMIQETKYGVYIKSFMEWNIDDKRWNQKYKGNEAYLIENGEITKPVKQPIIEITTPELWNSVNAIANNFELHAATCGKGEPMQGIPVSMGGASMRLKIRIR